MSTNERIVKLMLAIDALLDEHLVSLLDLDKQHEINEALLEAAATRLRDELEDLRDQRAWRNR